MYSITSTTQIDDSKVMNLIISAFEGGSDYWVSSISKRFPEGDITPEKLVFWGKPEFFATEGWWIDIDTDEDGPADFRLNAGRVQWALQKMAEDYPSAWGDILLDEGDAATGDVFLQLAVLGEERYG